MQKDTKSASVRKRFSFSIHIFRGTKERTITFSRFSLRCIGLAFMLLFGAMIVSVTLFIESHDALDHATSQLQEVLAEGNSRDAEIEEVAVVAHEVQVMIDNFVRDPGDEAQLVKSNAERAARNPDPLLVRFEDISGERVRELHNLNDLQYIASVLESSKPSFENFVSILELQNNLLSDIPSIWPLQNNHGQVTLEFGPNRHPKTNQWYLHKGIDIAGAYGVKVLASANGKVIEAGYDRTGYGNYVLLRHKYGFRTRYSHLSNIYVVEGQDVAQNEVIGLLGNTGISTGPHLDFQIILGTDVIDPAQFLKISRQQFQRWAGNR